MFSISSGLFGHLTLFVWCLAHVVGLSNVEHVVASNKHFADLTFQLQFSFAAGFFFVRKMFDLLLYETRIGAGIGGRDV